MTDTKALETSSQPLLAEIERLKGEVEKWKENRPKGLLLDQQQRRAVLAETRLAAAEAEAQKLREALKGLLGHYVGLVESGDAGNWDAEKETVVIEARKALGGSK